MMKKKIVTVFLSILLATSLNITLAVSFKLKNWVEVIDRSVKLSDIIQNSDKIPAEFKNYEILHLRANEAKKISPVFLKTLLPQFNFEGLCFIERKGIKLYNLKEKISKKLKELILSNSNFDDVYIQLKHIPNVFIPVNAKWELKLPIRKSGFVVFTFFFNDYGIKYRYQLSAIIYPLKKVWVAKFDLKKGQIITKDLIEKKLKRLNFKQLDLLAEKIISMKLEKNVKKGEIILDNFLALPFSFKAGQTVNVKVKRKNIIITMPAKVVRFDKKTGNIQVKINHKIFQAKAISDNEIILNM